MAAQRVADGKVAVEALFLLGWSGDNHDRIATRPACVSFGAVSARYAGIARVSFGAVCTRYTRAA